MNPMDLGRLRVMCWQLVGRRGYLGWDGGGGLGS